MKVYTHPTYSYVTVAEIPRSEISKIDVAMCNQPKETLEQFIERQTDKPDVLINGGFFALSTGDTIFTIVDDGVEYSVDPGYLYGIGISGMSDISFSKYTKDGGFRDFICGYPVLVKNGKPYSSKVGSELNYKARRSMFGFNDDTVWFVTVDLPGLAYSSMKKIMVDLGASFAINLDGGGSTRMIVDGKTYAAASSNRPVDSVVAVYMKNENDDLYRVQVGAFTRESNAILLRNKIRSLNDSINAGYKNAYVRLIDGLYKVQVGAYSNRDNADRVAANLKLHGYSCYVTKG